MPLGTFGGGEKGAQLPNELDITINALWNCWRYQQFVWIFDLSRDHLCRDEAQTGYDAAVRSGYFANILF